MRALQFENVSKLYNLGSIGTGSLGRDINKWWKTVIKKEENPYLSIAETNLRHQLGDSSVVWALKDISFDVEQGDVVGIIGNNGSGKSTLLKILSRITTPTTGQINVKGRVASLLEVGTGFHPDLTGRDNIYMNGAIHGMTRAEITSKFDEIVEFSGVQRYVDTPVKRYSSGMKVRLGFAVAAFLNSEILVVDEVLAVGDAEFQKKAIGKMQSISKDNGRTVLFVSHNMNSVTHLCNRGIVLENGQMAYNGNISQAVNYYISDKKDTTVFNGMDGIEGFLSLHRAEVKSENSSSSLFENTFPIKIEMEVDIKGETRELCIGFNLISQFGTPIARADFNDYSQENTLPPGRYVFQFEIPANTLAPGSYSVVFDLAQKRNKRFTTPKSNLFFDVVMGKQPFGNTFTSVHPTHTSLIHEGWIKNRECLEKY